LNEAATQRSLAVKIRSTLLLCALLIGTQCALAKVAKEEFRTSKGKPVVVTNLIVRKTDCSITTTGVPTFPRAPKHGTVEMEAVMMDLPAAGPCPAQKAPIITLVYVPQPDFVGSDDVQINIANHNETIRLDYRIIVSNGGD